MALNPNLVVSPSASIREVLEAVTKNSRQAVAVVDPAGRLVGLVTDGDIRRAMLRGASFEASVAQVMNRSPITAEPSVRREDAIALMQRRVIRHLPLVDGDRVLVDLLVLEDLLEPPALSNVAVLMAGGAGSRLRPLTEAVPKPLLKVGGKPVLEILLERLRGAGVREFFITVNYKSHMIEDHFGDGGRLGVRVRYIREAEPLGTAGALRLADELPRSAFFLVNGDILTKCDFRAMLNFHEAAGVELTVGTVPHSVELPYGILQVQGERLTGVSEKPRLDFTVNSGIYVVERACVDLIPPGRVFDMPELIRALVAAGRRVAAFPILDYWLDIGRHDDFWKADRDVAEGLLD